MIVFFLLDRPAQPAVKPAVQPTMHPVVQPVAQPAQGSVLPNKLCSQWCRLLCSQPFCNSPVELLVILMVFKRVQQQTVLL
jgi:hypothetical protein